MQEPDYIGVTTDRRSQRHIPQIRIAGIVRQFGRFDEKKDAALAADNARLFLQEFFPKPLEMDLLNFGTDQHDGPNLKTREMRQTLLAEQAPQYRQSDGTEAPEDTQRRRIVELQEAFNRLQQEVIRVGHLLKSLQQ